MVHFETFYKRPKKKKTAVRQEVPAFKKVTERQFRLN